MFSAAQTPFLERLRDDMVDRGMKGVGAHLFGATVTVFAVSGSPGWECHIKPLLVLLISTPLRLLFMTLLRQRTPLMAWFWIYAGFLLLAGWAWGWLLSGELLRSGWGTWQSTVMSYGALAISMGGTAALAPMHRVYAIYQASFWMPAILVSVGALQDWTMALMCAVLSAYLHAQSGQYYREYWAALYREADLHKANEEAKSAGVAKGMFVANVSHELRTPLHGILGMLDLLLAEPLAEREKNLAGTARSSAESLLGLVDDILDFSKIEAGKMTLESIPFSPAELVAEAGGLLEVTARRKGLVFETHIAPDLPWVLGDPLRLRQVLFNLGGNAVKFTAAGRVTLRVERQPGGPGYEVRLRWWIEDTGIGIPESKQAGIFAPFAQADGSTTRRYGGTGLGLAITRQLVALMGSELQLRSVAGQGSTFWFDTVMPVSAAIEAAPAKDRAKRRCRPLRVLLVEDNVVNQRVARGILERGGHRVRVADNGLRALDRWRSEHFDIILMDMQMPEMAGDEATHQLRSEEPAGVRIPVVGLSANASPEDRRRCLEAGMDDYLTKPFRAEDLLDCLAKWTDPERDPTPNATAPEVNGGAPRLSPRITG